MRMKIDHTSRFFTFLKSLFNEAELSSPLAVHVDVRLYTPGENLKKEVETTVILVAIFTRK